ncbi:MAG: hypothetical protein DLM58_05670 [Pseudonocardiales bacterium]|nr:MAG: hypothetical protein DLM58_05670 [Pseudonocardiales bacterium]
MHLAYQTDNVSVSSALYAVPRWTLIPAALAPISLVGAWLAVGLAQPGEYDAIRQMISVLAGYAAADRWIMTLGLYAVSICQLVVAIGLSAARPLARVLLVMGGLAGLGVAIFPQPMHGSGAAHMVFATLSVTFLALWPATLGSRSGSTPAVLTIRGSVLVTAVFLGLLAWVFAAAHGGGALGVAERVDTAVANSWPLVIILVLRRSYSVAEPES